MVHWCEAHPEVPQDIRVTSIDDLQALLYLSLERDGPKVKSSRGVGVKALARIQYEQRSMYVAYECSFTILLDQRKSLIYMCIL